MPIMRVRPATRTDLAAIAAVLLAVVFAWSRLWVVWDHPASFFGGDLVAYLNGAHRLAATGTPYHDALHAGPVANAAENVPIAYLYSPVLAQLFLVIRDVPIVVISWVNVALQLVLFAWLLPHVYRAGGGQVTVLSVSAIWAGAVLFFPLNFALFGGNLSGWIAAGVGLVIVASNSAGLVTAMLSILKSTPLVLALPLVGSRKHLIELTACSATIVVVSAALAPAAWLDWLTVLPNIIRFPMAESLANLSISAVFASAGLASVGVVAHYSVAACFALGSIALAARGQVHAATAAAVATLLFLPVTMYDHYLAATFVISVFVWPRATAAGRVGLAIAFLLGLLFWFPSWAEINRAALLVAAILASVLTVLVNAHNKDARVAMRATE
jgi:hypothetical protein